MRESVLPLLGHLRKHKTTHADTQTRMWSTPDPSSNQIKPKNHNTEWIKIYFYLSKLSKSTGFETSIQNIRKVKRAVKWKYSMRKIQNSNDACMCWRWISLWIRILCYRRQTVCMYSEKATTCPYTYMGPVLWSVPLELGGYLWGSACPSAYSLPSSCWL